MDIKLLYQQANELNVQAMALLTEYEGKEADMPADKKAQVDALLNQVQEQLDAAKREEETQERIAKAKEHKSRLGEITHRPNVYGARLDNPEVVPDEMAKKHIKAAVNYWMTGETAEIKALAVGSPATGGYLVHDTFLNQILMAQKAVLAIRRIAKVLPPVPVGSVVVPTAIPLSDAGNNSETGEIVFDTIEPFGSRKLTPREYDKGILISTAMLRNPAFDIETWMRDQMAQAFSRKEEYDFISGDGNSKALGILNTPGKVSFTTAAANTVDADDVINWIYALPSSYAATAKILCNRAFIRKIRTMKTGLGDYVWQPGLQTGVPNKILDTPYELSDRFDDGLDANDAWEANAEIAVVGDWSYYWIVDALDMYIQRLDEKYATTKQVGFIGTKSTDGMCVLPEAFVTLKVKA